MNKVFVFSSFLIICTFISCSHNRKEDTNSQNNTKIRNNDSIIVDSHYTFDEAIAGSKAPKDIIMQLQLINVQYYSTDKRIHKGQLLTNKLIVNDLQQLFQFMFQQQFPITKAIPIVNYNWDDNLSMQDNNTSSFCFRNASYSKHANGMAIDINPFFNPVRWKDGYKYRSDKPKGAFYDSTVLGTFYPSHYVVHEFKKHKFRWGHSFMRNYDDQHFEK